MLSATICKSIFRTTMACSLLFMSACDGTNAIEVTDDEFEVTDWTEKTHSNDVAPDFAEVFDDTQVKRLDLVVTAGRWQSMLEDMTQTYGAFGGTSGGGPRGGGGGAGLLDTSVDPIFVPADLFYKGKQWYRVGIRFKGNSSLQSSWQGGILKLSFKIDFDEYEDTYPQIKNQRFYGFKKFSLKNNYLDKSQMREKVAADVFAAAGLAVSHTAFYTLYIDHGDGPEYFGLYTLVEEVNFGVTETQFSSDSGNLYKPEEGSASFVAGTFSKEDFIKKTNEEAADWSDIEALFAALHDSTRTTDVTSWRKKLESIFDVDVFVKYLAVNGTIQNWDTYGRMPHNYYLYAAPATSKLTWIPWDNNESLQLGKQGGAVALDFSDLQANAWPLIGYVYADATYKAKYDQYLKDVIDGAFAVTAMQAKYDTYKALIEPYATTERDGFTFLNSASEFQSAITELKTHASGRAAAVASYLGQ